MGIDQTNNSTHSACDEQRRFHPGCTHQYQSVDYESTREGVPEGHEKLHAYVITWVGGLLTSESLRL